MSRRAIAFWALFAVTAAIYVAMVTWSLPKVTAAAGGLMPFDLRPTGYSFEEAVAFLSALSAEGRAFYLDVQQRLDLFYPALMAATVGWAIWLMAPASWGGWRWPLALTPIPGGVFDYLENHAVAAMLRLGAERTTPELVMAADRWTRFKSIATTLAMAILIVLLIGWAIRRLRMRGAAGL